MKCKMTLLCGAALFSWSALSPVQAQSNIFNELYSFAATSGYPDYINGNGASPTASLVLSSNTLFGTSYFGGSGGVGTVFKINTDGSNFANLHIFTNSDGANPDAGLILSGNTLYGTTVNGGSASNGAVFRVNTDGSDFTNLYSFTTLVHNTNINAYTNGDGANPKAVLVLSGNTLFGTAVNGGNGGNGTVFRINTDGSHFTNLYSFTASSYNPSYNPTNSDGANPDAGLILSGDTLYGTAFGGGINANGTMFGVNTDGTGFTNLHTFTALVSGTNGDGASPAAGLILSGNTLYGTASAGGSQDDGVVFRINTDGTDFTNLYSFTAISGSNSTNSDGDQPEAGLILWGNTLYGTAQYGGSAGNGTVFGVNTDGSDFTNLYNFTAQVSSINGDGANPIAGLVLSGHTLYGTAENGGGANDGTVFALTLPVPLLKIAAASHQVVISWPAWASGYEFQAAANLSSGSWSNIINGIGTVGTNCVFTNTLSNQAAYFRLQHQ